MILAPEIIKQRMRTDCAICTIAMAIGRPYEDVMTAALQSDAWHPEKGMRAEYKVLERLGFKQMANFRVMHRGPLAPEYFLHFSWGRPSILAVPSLNLEGMFHSVYWTGSDLLDPCTSKTYSDWKALRPDELILFGPTAAATPVASLQGDAA